MHPDRLQLIQRLEVVEHDNAAMRRRSRVMMALAFLSLVGGLLRAKAGDHALLEDQANASEQLYPAVGAWQRHGLLFRIAGTGILQAFSPCLNAGSTKVPNYSSVDLNGTKRNSLKPTIGAYEH